MIPNNRRLDTFFRVGLSAFHVDFTPQLIYKSNLQDSMKHFSIFTFLIIINFLSCHADIILMRNGSEIPSTVIQLSDDNVVYMTNKNAGALSVATKDVYMIKFDKRGNIYISDNNKRISGENQIIPKGVDIVYLKSGREYPAYNLKVESEKITFLSQRPSKKNIPIAQEYPRDEVFKIKYADGIIDVISEFTVPEDTTQQEPQPENIAEEQLQPEYQVIFHNVGKKESVASIAKRYEVSEGDIISWNNLPQKIKSSSLLTPGTQLMIYVKPQ